MYFPITYPLVYIVEEVSLTIDHSTISIIKRMYTKKIMDKYRLTNNESTSCFYLKPLMKAHENVHSLR